MRVVVAGASGVVGRVLVPTLVARGHEVALARSSASGAMVAKLGAEPLFADALDLASVSDAFRRFKPDIVIHQLTALRATTDLWRLVLHSYF
jgi:nucleoside-diphosphate-sugar epimerase